MLLLEGKEVSQIPEKTPAPCSFSLEFLPYVKWRKGNAFIENINVEKLSRPKALLAPGTHRNCVMF